MASAIRTRLIPAVVLLAIVGLIWWARRKPPETYSVAYVNDRSAIVWSTTAQVRQRVADLKYGQRVAVLGHSGDEDEVRSDDGVQGWVDAQLLMAPDLWQHATDLLARARAMPVQASGHTRAVSNVHMEPSRTATRVFQFGRNVSVVVLDRKVAAAPAPTAAPAPALRRHRCRGAPEGDAAGNGASGSDEAQPKQEDWLLVLHVAQQSGADANRSRRIGGSRAVRRATTCDADRRGHPDRGLGAGSFRRTRSAGADRGLRYFGGVARRCVDGAQQGAGRRRRRGRSIWSPERAAAKGSRATLRPLRVYTWGAGAAALRNRLRRKRSVRAVSHPRERDAGRRRVPIRRDRRKWRRARLSHEADDRAPRSRRSACGTRQAVMRSGSASADVRAVGMLDLRLCSLFFSPGVHACSHRRLLYRNNLHLSSSGNGAFQAMVRANCDDPVGPAVDTFGRVYLASRGSGLLDKFDSAGVPLISFEADGVRHASGIAVDSGGGIYIADAATGEIRVYFPEGDFLRSLRVAPERNFAGPFGLSVAADGTIFVPDPSGGRIQVLSSQGKIERIWRVLPSAAGGKPRSPSSPLWVRMDLFMSATRRRIAS